MCHAILCRLPNLRGKIRQFLSRELFYHNAYNQERIVKSNYIGYFILEYILFARRFNKQCLYRTHLQ